MSKYINWNEKEDKILCDVYGSNDKDYITSVLPNRTWTGIQARASKLKLTRMNYFSDEEIEIIKKNYLLMRSGNLAKLLNRSINVVENKARKLGLVKKTKWKEKEIKYLKSNFGKINLYEISDYLKRTISSIYHKIQELNLQRKTKRYSLNNDDLLENLIYISNKIGRTPSRNELTQLGLPSEIVFSQRFGSYGNACELAGLEINTGITSRKKYLSKNNDLCLSNAEKKITDFLIDSNISFQKEVPYSIFTNDGGKMICDWLLHNGTVVEYFGMNRNKKYKEKMIRKIDLCKKHNINLIQIIDRDLNNLEEIFSHYM